MKKEKQIKKWFKLKYLVYKAYNNILNNMQKFHINLYVSKHVCGSAKCEIFLLVLIDLNVL